MKARARAALSQHDVRSLPVYGLLFVAAMLSSALAPLGPVYADTLGFSQFQVGALFAAGSTAMVVFAFPIGLISDRVGARRLTAGSAALLALSALGQGLGHSFWLVLLGRTAFGIAFVAVWTAGLALLSDGAPLDRRTARLGAAIPVSGTGTSIGPAFAGVVASRFGLAVPFLVIALIAIVAALALALSGDVPESQPERRAGLREVIRAARGSRLLASAVAIMTIAGLSGNLSYLLIPLRLEGNGMSVGLIGVVLGCASVVYIATSITVTRAGAHAATSKAAAAAVAALGIVLLLPALSNATAVLVLFLILRSSCNATLSTIAYPLAVAGAAESMIGVGAAIGLVNAAWATISAISPLAGAGIADALGDRAPFAILAPLTLASCSWFILRRSSRR